MKRITFFAALALTIQARAFNFQPELSLNIGRTVTRNYTESVAAGFSLSNRKINTALELKHKFALSYRYFLRSGVRIGSYKSYAAAGVPGSNNASLAWVRKYTNVGVPLQFGATIKSHGVPRAEIFAGPSLGVLMTSYSMVGVSSGASVNGGSSTVSAEINDNNPMPSFFFPTADIGVNYLPFRSLPALSLGVLCSVQANGTTTTSYTGKMTADSGIEYSYSVKNRQNIMNVAFTGTYTFAKRKHKGPSNNDAQGIQCPR